MIDWHAVMTDELGDEFSVTVTIPDMVKNVTKYIQELYPESSIQYITPEGL